jgi:hypothetical protein
MSEHIDRVPNEHVVIRAHTEGVTTTATRRFGATPDGSLLSGDVEYRFDVPWTAEVLLPLMEFQARRPMRRRKRLGAREDRVDAA